VFKHFFTSKFETPQNIIYMLGFHEIDFTFINYPNPLTIDLQAYYPADLSCAMSYLYLYCDVLEPQIIGTKLAPLLQAVNVEGKYTSLFSKSYTLPHYIPILGIDRSSFFMLRRSGAEQVLCFDLRRSSENRSSVFGATYYQ